MQEGADAHLRFLEECLLSRRLRSVLTKAASYFGTALDVSRCVFALANHQDDYRQPPVEWSRDEEHAVSEVADAVCALRAMLGDRRSVTVFSPAAVEDVAVKGVLNRLAVSEVVFVPCIFRGSALCCGFIFIHAGDPGWSEEHRRFAESLSGIVAVAAYRALAEAALAESEKFYRDMAEAEGVGSVEFSSTGMLSWCSESLTPLLGEMRRPPPSDEAVVRALVIPEDCERIIRWIREVYTGDRASAIGTVRLRAGHGSSAVLVQLRAFRSAEGAIGRLRLTFFDCHELRDADGSLYRRVLERANALLFRADRGHRLTFMSENASGYFGVTPDELLGAVRTPWYELIHPEDNPRVVATLEERSAAGESFDEEFRVVNRTTGRVRWLLVHLVPSLDSSEGGWDGLAIDVTARHDAQEALEAQSRKVRALYAVSSAIRGELDPSRIALRGVAALIEATGADAGLCCLANDGEMDLLAHVGFGERLDSQPVAETIIHLAREVAGRGHTMALSGFDADSRPLAELSRNEGFLSGVLIPMPVEGEIVGTIGLFSRTRVKFDGGLVMLVTAAASQIGLATRQATLFALQRRQARNLAALYRMSHELSQRRSLDDLFQQAFAIMRDELGLERLWLGLVSEGGARIVGQAAYGPGWRRRLVTLNVPLSGVDHPLAQVVRARSPLVLSDPEIRVREFPLRRIFVRMGVRNVVFVPLIAAEQVIGVLGVQPRTSEFHGEEVTLLSSLANEIASMLLTRRLEERIEQDERMRTVGVLAGGIAHNFNNLLQTILGHTSLLELDATKPTKVRQTAHLINDAGLRGATLVKQLLTFAHSEESNREFCDVNTVLESGRHVLLRLLGSGHELHFGLGNDLPRIFVDPRQLMHIVSALVANAVDAMPDGGPIDIRTDQAVLCDQGSADELTAGHYVRIVARDRGIGMDVETRRRCFEPFFSTKNVDSETGLSLSGAGLGLAAAYALAKQNGGLLTVESDEGQGSAFVVLLPTAGGSVAERGRIDVAAPDLGKGGNGFPLKAAAKLPKYS